VSSTFDDFVGALQAASGRDVMVEVMRGDDGHVVAELRGQLGPVVLGEDYGHDRRGVAWIPIGEQPRVGRGTGFWIDVARFRDAEVIDVMFRGMFDDLVYVITVGR
jgi:hypothetical protein